MRISKYFKKYSKNEYSYSYFRNHLWLKWTVRRKELSAENLVKYKMLLEAT